MRDVIIKIKGTQGLGDEKSVMELSLEGTCSSKDGKLELRYCEDTVIENAKIETVVTANKQGSVTLERKGALSSKLIIEEGKRNNCFYTVPEGSLTLGIFGKEVSVRQDASGGSIKMVYTIDADMNLISENTVEINFRER